MERADDAVATAIEVKHDARKRLTAALAAQRQRVAAMEAAAPRRAE